LTLDQLAERQDKVLVCIAPRNGRQYSIYQLPAEKWMPEEILWARHRWPGKVIGFGSDTAGRACDLVVPNYPVATP
jgi:hypothetical protein